MFWPLQLSCLAGLEPRCRSSQEGHRYWQSQGHISLGYLPDCLETVAKTMGFFRLLHCKIISPIGQEIKFFEHIVIKIYFIGLLQLLQVAYVL